MIRDNMRYNKRQQKKQLKKHLANKFGAKGKELNVIYKGLTSFNSSSNIKSIHDVGKSSNRIKELLDKTCLNNDQKDFLINSLNTKNILMRPKTIEYINME